MLSAKALIIGVASTATVTGVTYLTFTAIKEEEREDLELNKFSEEWNQAKDDNAKMQLLERELQALCKGNEDGCKDKVKIDNLINRKNPKLKDFFEDKKFSPAESANSGFTETCKKIQADMKIKSYCL